MARLLRGLGALAACCGLVSFAQAAHAQDILGHVIVGYQGWFSNPNDGSPVGALGTGGNDHRNLETYPDMSDFPASEQFPTSWGSLGDGAPATMFSSDRTFTANLHAKWMKDNGVDVAAIQRFGEVWPDSGNTYNSQKNQIETKMADALAPVGLKFYVEYDASSSGTGGWGSNFVADVEADWLSNQDLDNNQPIWKRANYAHEGGKPVVELWGLGGNFNNIDSNPSDWLTLINWFKGQGVYVIAGVPTGWNGGPWGDALSGFTAEYQACNAISPWVVGRFSGTAGADSYASTTLGMNKTWCTQNGVAFLPCVYPGTSFHNSNGGTENQIPRINGGLLWEQFANLRNLGIGQCFISMFDEMNEATNIMNSAANAKQSPASTWFLDLDADGQSLSPDFYLRLTKDGGAMLKGQTGLTFTPPTAHWTDEPFMDVATAVPGTLQAENYDRGGQGIAYNIGTVGGSSTVYRYDAVDLEATTDTGGGYDMGWTAAGQWFHYTVNVAAAGTYNVAIRVASPSGGSMHVSNSAGSNLSGSITVPSTGGNQTFATVNATVTLPAGTQVLTVNQDSGGYNINSFTFTTGSGSAPSAPANLTATAGNAQVILTWNAVSGATVYNIYRGTTSGSESQIASVTPPTTTYTDIGLINGTKYYYTVKAGNSFGTSPASNEVNATPAPGTTTIDIACGNSAQPPFVADIDFSGGTVSGGTTHAIDTSAVTSPAPASVYQHGRYGNLTYTIPGLTAGSSYTVRLDFCEYAHTAAGQRVFNVSINGAQVLTNFDIFATAGAEYKAAAKSFTATANSSGQIVIALTTVTDNAIISGIEITGGSGGGTAPSAVALTASAGNGQVTLTWTGGTGSPTATFNVLRGTSSGTETQIATNVTSGYINTGLTNGTPYFYKVQAVNSVGTTTSNEVNATPAATPVAPSIPTLTATPGSGSVALSWTTSTGTPTPTYTVMRGTSSGSETTQLASGLTGTTFNDTGLANGTYWYVVKAINSAGTATSAEKSAIVGGGVTGIDLIVTSISWTPASPASGNHVVFTAVVKNQGSVATPAGTIVGVQFAMDGSTSVLTWSDTDTTSLAAGASVTLTANNGTNSQNYWTAVSGSHTVQAWVDDVNRIAESNENNNKTTATVSVP